MNIHKTESHTHTHTAYSNLDIPIFAKTYEFYKELTQILVVFPKSKKYSLGQKIDQVSLNLIEIIITAGYLPREQKMPALQKSSIKLDLLKILIRISFETKCIDNKKYQRLAAYLIEIGRMLGGWIKSVKK